MTINQMQVFASKLEMELNSLNITEINIKHEEQFQI